jgi:5-carboxyvanillate decarboxylase
MTDTVMKGELRTGGDRGYLRIATEEAFGPPEMFGRYREILASGGDIDPGFRSLWGFYSASPSPRATTIMERLTDLGPRRLADMDATGIDRQVIALTAPGVQILNRDDAVGIAELANDRLAEAMRRYPSRFSGMTAIAPQDPNQAAKEIERGARKLGMSAVVVNSHTHGEYLDETKFWPIFEAAEAMGQPLYIHPQTPSRRMIGPMLDKGLDSALFGFAVETGLHLLRIIVAGVFDRFPKLQIIVGHCGEALPFWMFRFDYMHAASVRAGRYASMQPLQRKVSDYLRENVYVTTSGMAWEPAISFCQKVLGMDRVLYAMDYPYQYEADEVRTCDNLPLTQADKKRFFEQNAKTVFGLSKGN